MEESEVSTMSDQRVSMFVCHKVASHKRAAARIKEILQSRTERLDVHICEEILPGDDWRKWITDRIAHSQIALVILPHIATDLTWIGDEIGKFQATCPTGRLVVLKPPSRPVPNIVQDLQIINTSKDQLQEYFLKPLYRNPDFLRLDTPLNPRVTDADLTRDAEMIEDALLGIVDPRSEFFGESLVVETVELDVTTSLGLDGALVRAPNGCRRILDWNRRSFSWNELRTRAAEDAGKGTFWVSEMEQVITDVARQNRPRVMTSTFRGRGKETAGQIFRPQLDRVDFVDDTPVDTPVRYHFVFHEVLVPELVRGPKHIGEVFNLLYIATRVRWEVLNPFVVNLSLTKDTPPSRLDMSQEARHDLIGRVSRSLRIIEHEAERHKMLEAAVSAFDDSDRELIVQVLRKREWIRNAIETAANQEDFEQFMGELMRGLELNGEAIEILASRFLQLVQEDRGRVQQMLQRIRSKEAQLQ
jgi:hypothetical protein